MRMDWRASRRKLTRTPGGNIAQRIGPDRPADAWHGFLSLFCHPPAGPNAVLAYRCFVSLVDRSTAVCRCRRRRRLLMSFPVDVIVTAKRTGRPWQMADGKWQMADYRLLPPALRLTGMKRRRVGPRLYSTSDLDDTTTHFDWTGVVVAVAVVVIVAVRLVAIVGKTKPKKGNGTARVCRRPSVCLVFVCVCLCLPVFV